MIDLRRHLLQKIYIGFVHL